MINPLRLMDVPSCLREEPETYANFVSTRLKTDGIIYHIPKDELDEAEQFLGQRFLKEMVEYYFKLVNSPDSLALRFMNNYMYLYIDNVKICKEFNSPLPEGLVDAVAFKFPMPKTIGEFMDNCDKSDVKLEWNESVLGKQNDNA